MCLMVFEAFQTVVWKAFSHLGIWVLLLMGLNIPLKVLPMGSNGILGYDYREARLVESGQRWYVVWYCWHIERGCLVRQRDYSINGIVDLEERRRRGLELVNEINALLRNGAVHGDCEVAGAVATGGLRCGDAVNRILALKAPIVRRSVYLSLCSQVEDFIAFLREERLEQEGLEVLDRKLILRYRDRLLLRDLKPVTVNNYMTLIQLLFSEMVKREWIEDNPFAGLSRLKEEKSALNRAFTEEERRLLMPSIRRNAELYLCCQLMYYCFLRPNEIRMLQLEHVRLEDGLIVVPGAVSKNGKSEYVTIPMPLRDYLEGLGLERLPKKYYLLGLRAKAFSRNVMSTRFRKLRDRLELSKDCTLYSWKHTGVVTAYRAGVDIKSLQRQCRHYSVAMTDAYLKSLGLYLNKEMILKMPPIDRV